MDMDSKSKIASKLGLSKLSAACLSKSSEDVAVLLDAEGSSQGQGVNKVEEDDWTPVHFACINKKAGAAILQLLISKGYSLHSLTNDGRSPLHEACRSGTDACARLILEHSSTHLHSALELKDKNGDTPLHLACRSGHKDVVDTLLTLGYHRLVESDAVRYSMCLSNSDKATPLGLAVEANHLETARLLFGSLPSGNSAAVLKDFSTIFPSHSKLIESLRATEFPPMNVFFLGDSESGKSTLIKTLQAHAQSTLSALYTLLPYVSHAADKHKVGIVPTVIEYAWRNHQCPMVFHDVTGHRHYAHEALFKCAENPLDSLFLITVDIRVKEDVIKRKILYWYNFLTYILSQYLAKSRNGVNDQSMNESTLSVMVIGTFNDHMSSFSISGAQVMLTTLCRVICDENQDLLSRFEWKGAYALNARRAYSWKIAQLRSVLQEQCQVIHHSENSEIEHIPLSGYLLAAVVSDHLDETSASVVSFESVMECLKSSDNISCKLLRKADGDIDKVSLMRHCRSLKRFNQFSIYETSHSSPNLHRRFIIRNLHQLLSNIDMTIEGLSKFHSHGIISHTDLLTAFQGLNFPSGFIIQFMESFQICEGVTADGLKHMRQNIRTSRRSLNSRSSFRSYYTAQKQSSYNTPPVVHTKLQSQSPSETPPITRTRRGHNRTMSFPLPIDIIASRESDELSLPGTPLRSLSQSEKFESDTPKSSLHNLRPSKQHSNRYRQKDKPYCFFPTLVSSKSPDKWEKDYDKYTYGFAWSLIPNNRMYYFPPRFVASLLFRLLHSFAPFRTGAEHQHEKVCDLWNCGIMWQDSIGIRACVVIDDNQTVTLSMQCLQDQELECLKLRNLVIGEIMSQKSDLHPDIQMSGVLIPDDQRTDFPIHSPDDVPACFDKMEIGRAIVNGELVLSCTKRKNHVKMEDLLFFEPLTLLPDSLLQQLLDEDDQDEKISDEFCLDISKEISNKWQLLARFFGLHQSYIADVEQRSQAENLAPYWAALQMIQHLRDSVGEGKGIHTYRELKELLLEVSIFTLDELNNLASLYSELAP